MKMSSSRRRQLFVDDHIIESMDNVRRTMHQPRKKGAVIRPDVHQGESFFQIRSAPHWDKDKQVYRLNVCGKKTKIYESADGLHWKEAGTSELEVWVTVYDEADPNPLHRHKALLPIDNNHITQLGAAVSPDMITWSLLDIPPIDSYDEWNLSLDRDTGTFIATVKVIGPYDRTHKVWTSKDFIHWTSMSQFHTDELDQQRGKAFIENYVADPRMQPAFNHPTDPGQYKVDVYNFGVFAYEGLYIGMPTLYHAIGPTENYPNTYGFDLLQLASSRDLKSWNRLGDRQTFIEISPLGAGAYDLTQIMPPSSPIVRGHELFFYYTGLKYRGEYTFEGEFPRTICTPFPENDQDASAVCLAVLRRDGFVSIDADKNAGKLLTRPLIIDGTQLHVNVNASKGALSVAVLDLEGKTLAVSKPVQGDQPDIAVIWENDAFEALAGKSAKLLFTLENCQFFSFWLDE